MAALNELKLAVMVVDIVTGKFMELKHEALTLGADLEMDRLVRVTYFENNNGVPGLPMLQVIQDDEDIHPLKKDRLREQYRTRIIPTSTRGKMVDPVSGTQVHPDEQGAYPEGSISELEFWQTLPRAAVVNSDNGTIGQPVYAALTYDMQNMVNNGVI